MQVVGSETSMLDVPFKHFKLQIRFKTTSRAPIQNGPTSRTSTNKQIRDSPMRVSRPLRELIQIWDNMPNQHPPDLPSAPPHGTSISSAQTHHTRECHLIDRFDPASGYRLSHKREIDSGWVYKSLELCFADWRLRFPIGIKNQVTSCRSFPTCLEYYKRSFCTKDN